MATCVSNAKCPVSNNLTVALGLFRRYASAPASTKYTSFVPLIRRRPLGSLCSLHAARWNLRSLLHVQPNLRQTHSPRRHQQQLLFGRVFPNERNQFGHRKVPVANHHLFSAFGKWSNTCPVCSAVPPLSRFASPALSSLRLLFEPNP